MIGIYIGFVSAYMNLFVCVHAKILWYKLG